MYAKFGGLPILRGRILNGFFFFSILEADIFATASFHICIAIYRKTNGCAMNNIWNYHREPENGI